MADETNQRAVHTFLVAHLRSQAPFTRGDLRGVTSWNEKTFDTYLSKHYRPFGTEVGSGRFRVSEAFRRYASWDRFQALALDAPDIVRACLERRSTGIVALDPSVRRNGRISKRWGLRVNVDLGVGR
jgi:hypothetical protein